MIWKHVKPFRGQNRNILVKLGHAMAADAPATCAVAASVAVVLAV